MGFKRGEVTVGRIHRAENGLGSLAEMNRRTIGVSVGRGSVFREARGIVDKIGDYDRDSFVDRVRECKSLTVKERVVLISSRDGKGVGEIAKKLDIQTWEVELTLSAGNKKLLGD